MNEKGKATLRICEQKLKYLNYSDRTVETYLHYIDKFLQAQTKPAVHLTNEDFQHYLDNFTFTSFSQQNQIINAISFLYKYGLQRKFCKILFKRPRRQKKLPVIIDKTLILQKISEIDNIKHKAIIMLAYSVGLRVSEIINLKIADIDSSRMIIHIKNSKCKKDRIVPLSQNVLKILRTYYKLYKPTEYLFNGQFDLQYSTNSCNNIVKKYIGSGYHFHLLRHSCFTHLLESGTNLKFIQKLAGHSSSKTTEIYTHLSNDILSQIQLPV